MRTGNNYVCSYTPGPNPSPHSRHARPTCRRAPSPTFRRTCNSILPSTTLSPVCATHPLATTYDESAFDVAFAGRKPFRWPKPTKFPAPPSTLRQQLTHPSTPCVRRHRTLLTPPCHFPTIAQCLRKFIPATQATLVVVAIPGNYAIPTRTRMRRPLTPCHSPILSSPKTRWVFDPRNGGALRAPL